MAVAVTAMLVERQGDDNVDKAEGKVESKGKNMGDGRVTNAAAN
jgi:hypothetical protein